MDLYQKSQIKTLTLITWHISDLHESDQNSIPEEEEGVDMEKVNSTTHENLIAVAVKKGKPSQLALKWTVENLSKETKSIILIHAKRKSVEFGMKFGFRDFEIFLYFLSSENVDLLKCCSMLIMVLMICTCS